MTVENLIAKLSKLSPSATVWVVGDEDVWTDKIVVFENKAKEVHIHAKE